MKDIRGIASSLSEIVLEQARTMIESQVDEAMEKIMLETRLKILQNIRYIVREDIIGGRMVMTLEIEKAEPPAAKEDG